MTVHERLVLFFVIKQVAGRGLSDGVPAHRPRRDIKLPASPPCGLLNGEGGHEVDEGKSVSRTGRVPWIANGSACDHKT